MERDRPSSLSGSERAAGITRTTGRTPAPSDSVRATIDDMTTQMQAVVATAERAAAAIRLDAEEQAQRHLAEARRKADVLTAERAGLISDLTDDLLHQATNIRDHSERMATALQSAIASLDGIREASAGSPATVPADSGRVNGQAPAPGEAGARTEAAPVPEQHGAGDARTYTDIIGAPPPPLPAIAPPPTPEHRPIPEPTGPPQPTVEAAAAAAHPTDRPAEKTTPDLPLDVVMYATRRAANGVDPAVIASELRLRYGVEDPAPIIDRVMDPASRRS
jgi:hypothetical protein